MSIIGLTISKTFFITGGNIAQAEAFSAMLKDGEYFLQPGNKDQVRKIYG